MVIKLAVIHGEALLREALCRLIEASGEARVVATGSRVEEALAAIDEGRPDLVLLDLELGAGPLFAASQALTVLGARAPTLVLGPVECRIHPARILDLGARGYLSKACDPEELLEAVRAVHAGQRFVCSASARLMALSDPQGPGRDPFAELTPRELEIAVLAACGVTNAATAERLHLSPKTVSTYRRRLFDKLGVRNNVELARLAIELGLLSPRGEAG